MVGSALSLLLLMPKVLQWGKNTIVHEVGSGFPREKRGLAFGAIADTTQTKIEKEGPPFEVTHNDDNCL